MTQEIIDLVKAHDTTFDYSDDPTYYRKGRAEKEAILRKLQELGLDYDAALKEYKNLIEG